MMGGRVLSIVIFLLFILWGGLAIYGVMDFRATEAEGSSFTRGLNKLKEFFKWEAMALGVGVIAWIIQSSARAGGGVKWLGRAPLLLSGGFFALVIGAYVVAIIYSRVL